MCRSLSKAFVCYKCQMITSLKIVICKYGFYDSKQISDHSWFSLRIREKSNLLSSTISVYTTIITFWKRNNRKRPTSKWQNWWMVIIFLSTSIKPHLKLECGKYLIMWISTYIVNQSNPLQSINWFATDLTVMHVTHVTHKEDAIKN
jgi:hypothetical protein